MTFPERNHGDLAGWHLSHHSKEVRRSRHQYIIGSPILDRPYNIARVVHGSHRIDLAISASHHYAKLERDTGQQLLAEVEDQFLKILLKWSPHILKIDLCL